jgi:hypothetical protein
MHLPDNLVYFTRTAASGVALIDNETPDSDERFKGAWWNPGIRLAQPHVAHFSKLLCNP